MPKLKVFNIPGCLYQFWMVDGAVRPCPKDGFLLGVYGHAVVAIAMWAVSAT